MNKYLKYGVSVAALAVAATSASHAQDNTGDIETISVTGIRSSITAAADVKREADGVVDAISAEDIGDFPDSNLAESLQRIPGVSIDRANGEGNQISVRGFGPSFNLVTLNGRQMPGASSPKQENADSALQPRSFNFADISAEAVTGVQIHKTTNVHMPTGGIGATVNIATARPLDMADFVLSGSANFLYDDSNEVGDDFTPEVSGIVSKTWDFGDTGAFGVLVNASYSERDSREEIVSSDGWLRNARGWNSNVDESAVDPSLNPGVIFTPRNLVTDISDHSRTRENAQVVLQFAPNERVTATLDYTYSNYEDTIDRAQTAVWFDQNLVSGTADANGTLINPTITSDLVNFGAFDFNSYSDFVQRENKSLGFNVEWFVTDNLSVELDYHDSESHAQPDGRSSDFLAIVSGPIGTSYTADFNSGLDVPQLTYSHGIAGQDPFDPTLLRPNIALQRGNQMLVEVDEFNLRGSWENTSGDFLTAINFGYGHIEYNVTTNFIFDLDVFNGGITCGAPCNDSVTRVDRGGYGGDLSGTGTLPPYFLQYPASGLEEFLNSIAPSGTTVNVFELVTPVTNVIEEVTDSFYLQFHMEDDFNGMPFRAVAGVRYEATEVTGGTLGFPPSHLTWISSTELRAQNSSTEELFTLAGEYDVFLPQLDTSLEVRDDVLVRFSYGRSLSRPDLNRLRPNLSITDTRPGGPYQAVQGNPNLEPYISDNIDLSAEWYYQEGSYAAVSYFTKFVDNYIVTSTTRGEVPGTIGCGLTDPSIPGVNPPAPVDGTCSDPTAIFDITTPTNGEAAQITGYELALQHLFGETGFGVQANITFVEGDVDFDPAQLSQAVALLGLSDSANLVGFYENDSFQARIAYNWRDEFLLAVDQLRQPGEPVFVDTYGQWDVSASYNINDYFSVFAEGLNITDETATAHGRFDNQFVYAYHGGPRYTIGVRGKF